MNVSFAPQIEAAARRHGLDPRLLAAVAAQETGGPGSNSGRNVVGDGGHGHGLFQIDDRYHAFARSSAAMDPAANADYAAGMISDNLKRYGGNVREALSAYNAGDPNATGTTTQWADGRTLGYADSVMRHYQEICGDSGSTPAEMARADQPDASANTNGLLNALLSMTAPAASTCPQARGLDSTGHRRDTGSDFTIINGGDDS
jgi:Transglycosylase SLT domain